MTIIKREWAMPNKWTFKIKPIKELLIKYNVGQGWIDPFCGYNSPAEYKNDLNPNNKFAQYNLEALTQVARSYNNIGLKFKSKENPTGGFPKGKKKISELLKKNQHCISFGWNTCGLGKKNNMEIVEILIVCHGGNRNDTLVVVEKKIIMEDLFNNGKKSR